MHYLRKVLIKSLWVMINVFPFIHVKYDSWSPSHVFGLLCSDLSHNLFPIKQICTDNNRVVCFNATSIIVKVKVIGTLLLQSELTSPLYPLHVFTYRVVYFTLAASIASTGH